MAASSTVWVDGSLRARDAAAVRADDSAFSEARGCYTSVRIRAGAPRFAERHVQRLVRDARALGLPRPDPQQLRRALDGLARAAFGSGDGIVRIQLSSDRSGALHVVGVARGLGDDPPAWRAVTAPFAHPGSPVAGAKLTDRLHHALALDAARSAGAQEALWFDRTGRLVEGARTNLVVLCADGRLSTPPLARGAVAGVALSVLSERLAMRSRDLSRRALFAARAVAIVNAVRGARAVVALDADSLGDEGPALAERLNAVLDDDDD